MSGSDTEVKDKIATALDESRIYSGNQDSIGSNSAGCLKKVLTGSSTHLTISKVREPVHCSDDIALRVWTGRNLEKCAFDQSVFDGP